MQTEFWHREIIEVDLQRIATKLTREEFLEFYECYLDAIQNAKKQPFRPGWQLIHDLSGWNEYKFFEVNEPVIKVSPQMRLVYHYNRDNRDIYILAVGFRNSKETRASNEENSIYHIATERLKYRTNVDSWIEINN